MNDQILREFLAETEDLLEVLFGDLQALRVRHAEGRARRELVGRVFRHVHTIKGSSATIELNGVARIAHEFETLLDSVRLGRVAVDDVVLDALDDAANVLSQSLERVARGEPQPQPHALIERLRKLAHHEEDKGRPPEVRQALAALPEDIARSLSEHEAHRLHESIAEGARLFIVAVNFELATFDERFRSLSDTLAEDGEIISTLPGLETASPDQIGFRIVYAAKASREELGARISSFGQSTITELGRAVEAGVSQNSAAAPSGGPSPRATGPLSTRVRVELRELDAAISATHELLAEATRSLRQVAADGHGMNATTELVERMSGVRRGLIKLEEKLIGLRMVPVAQMLERAERAGRIAARLTGKQVYFESEGGEVRLDKSLADAMADPLLHILRNAVDHGIEPSAERASLGKDAHGRVRLRAWAEGNSVHLRVTDDGRGIDPKSVTHAAARAGIVEAGKLLTKEQAMRLIFRPGFSTAQTVSNVSGRGVGLDVVEKAIELVGGELKVESAEGEGTAFEMVLPTTLALTSSLVIDSAGHRYCIDEKQVAETVLVPGADIDRTGETERVLWRGTLVPLIRLRQLLGQPPREEVNGESVSVIISRAFGGRESTALAVDAIGEGMEALVRGLGRHRARWRGISGATELEDGTTALALDLPRLIETNL